MIRVLHVLATLKRAGAETMVTGLVRRLDPAVFQPSIVSLFDPFPGGLESTIAQIPVTHLGKRAGFDPRMWPRLRSVMRRVKPDIVHTHSYVMRYTLAGPGVRLALLLHHDDPEREVAYDRNFKLSPLVDALDGAARYGLALVSMKRDWATVFAGG